MFDANGYKIAETLISGALQQQTSYMRQAGSELVLQVTDPLGRKTDYTYDTCGNRTTITQLPGTSLAATTTLTYQTGTGTYPCIATFNRVLSVRDPINRTTTLGYDPKGNLTSATNPLNQATTLAYDPAGNPQTITNALMKTWSLSWQAGVLISYTDPLNRTTTQVGDTLGRVTSITNPLGHTTIMDYDLLSRVTRVLDPLLGATAMSWDGNSNLLSLTDARNGTTSYAYDNMDQVSTRTDPLLRSEGTTYDLAGNPATFTDRKSQPTTFTHDGFDRLTQVSYTGAGTVTYTYDNGDRVTQVTDSVGGTATLTWDNFDRLTQEVTPQGTVTYTYDLAGQRSSMTVQGQAAVNYTYDPAGRVTQIAQGSAVVTMAYDAAGRRTSTTLPNGVSMVYKYDFADQLTGIDYMQGGTLIGDVAYGYDNGGNRNAIGGSFARTGLPAAVTSAVYDAANRLTQWGGTALAYDFNGNMTSDGTNTFAWNSRDQLTSMTGGSFTYDGMGRRASRTVGGATTTYLHDGLNVVQQFGAQEATLLTGLGVDEIYTRTDGTGARTFLTDALGSTLGLADATGAVQTQYTFQPYGSATVTGQASANPFQYTGRENDGTGLYYYRARYYHPGVGRFISEDPIEFADGPNLYGYAVDSPLKFDDPLGLYGGIDDAAFLLGGALLGLGGQAFGDWVAGRRSGWEDYVGSAVGGAVGGWALLYTGPVGAGAAGAAIGNIAKQLLKISSGEQCTYDMRSTVFDASIGAFTGSIGGKALPGITTGRGNYNAIYKQMTTKFRNGTISTVTPRTAAKMFIGRATDTGMVPGTGVAAIASLGDFVSPPVCECR